MPAGSGSVELSVGTYGRPGPPLRVTVGRASSGDRPGGYRGGWVRVPFGGPDANRRDGAAVPRICVRNRGHSRLAVAGKVTSQVAAARVARRPSRGRITLRWRAERATTWWADAATIARRVTRGKADFGPWAPLVLLALVWTGALALVLRSARA